MVDTQPRHPRSKLSELSAVCHGFQHGQNVGAASAMAAKARYVAFNSGKVDPQAALRHRTAEIADRFYHAGITWTFKQHSVSCAEKRQQLVFQRLRCGDSDYLPIRLNGFVTFSS